MYVGQRGDAKDVLTALGQNKEALVIDTPERRRWVLGCHYKIFLAIKDRQPEAARQAMHEHLSDIIDRSVLAMARAQKRREQEISPHSGAFYGVGN